MTYLDGLHAGLWLLGALTPIAALPALYVLVVVLIDVPHRVRVLRLRRQTRRSGRGITVRNSDGSGFSTVGRKAR